MKLGISTGIVSVLVLAGLCLCCDVAQPHKATARVRPEVQKANHEMFERQSKLGKEEQEAEATGDYKKAEAICDKMIAQGAHLRTINTFRYLLYEKEGRGRDAYAALKNVLNDTPTSRSSNGFDPRMLTHFADLSEEYGSHEEAMSSYWQANRVAYHYMSPALDPKLSSDSSDEEVKAAAYYVSGIDSIFRLKSDEAVKSMRLAVSMYPQWDLAHFGLGYALQQAGCKNEKMMAESYSELKRAAYLADGETKAAIKFQARMLGFPDGPGTLLSRFDQKGFVHLSLVVPPSKGLRH